jgi:DNA-directed RNA polymerase
MDLIYSTRDPEAETNSWTLPDGFKVTERVHSPKKKSSISVPKWYSLEIEYQEYEANEMSKSLAPNIIHSIDAYILREVIRRCPFQVSTIHDSFGCHPNHATQLRETYKEVICELNDSNLLSTILSEIAGTDITIEKRNTLTNDMIVSSMHALC